ncbi:MAG: hypothetical protein AAF585_00050 [Verrucomicrobiota bacterium]
MPQPTIPKLDSDDPFPELTLDLTTGEKLQLPSEKWTLLLIYRGYW